jgi:hypothetical protein
MYIYNKVLIFLGMKNNNRVERYIDNINLLKKEKSIKIDVDDNLINRFILHDEIYQKLEKLGFPDRLNYLHEKEYHFNLPKPFSKDVIEYLLSEIENPDYSLLVVNLLRESRVKYDGTKLKAVFENVNNDGKWGICDSIIFNTPININDWIIEKYLNSSDHGVFMLAEVIPKVIEKDKAREILLQGFEDKPAITASVLGKKFKDKEILDFLQVRIDNYDKKKLPYKEMKKAIVSISKKVICIINLLFFLCFLTSNAQYKCLNTIEHYPSWNFIVGYENIDSFGFAPIYQNDLPEDSIKGFFPIHVTENGLLEFYKICIFDTTLEFKEYNISFDLVVDTVISKVVLNSISLYFQDLEPLGQNIGAFQKIKNIEKLDFKLSKSIINKVNLVASKRMLRHSIISVGVNFDDFDDFEKKERLLNFKGINKFLEKEFIPISKPINSNEILCLYKIKNFKICPILL